MRRAAGGGRQIVDGLSERTAEPVLFRFPARARVARAPGCPRLADLPVTSVFTSVYLGHLTGYGILLCRLSELHTA